jgi:hypothetical protein
MLLARSASGENLAGYLDLVSSHSVTWFLVIEGLEIPSNLHYSIIAFSREGGLSLPTPPAPNALPVSQLICRIASLAIRFFVVYGIQAER